MYVCACVRARACVRMLESAQAKIKASYECVCDWVNKTCSRKHFKYSAEKEGAV